MWKWTWPWKSRLCRAKVDETQVAIECTLLVPSWVKLIRSFFVITAFVGHSCRWSWRAAKGGQPEVSEANETIMKTLTVEWVRWVQLPRSCFEFWVFDVYDVYGPSEALRRLYDAQVLLQSYEEQPSHRSATEQPNSKKSKKSRTNYVQRMNSYRASWPAWRRSLKKTKYNFRMFDFEKYLRILNLISVQGHSSDQRRRLSRSRSCPVDCSG